MANRGVKMKFHNKIMEWIQKQDLLRPGDNVLIGCSGGIDSLVLLHFLKAHEEQLAITVSAVHVDHMLRGEDSAADRKFVERLCSDWNVPCFSRSIPIPEILKAAGGNKQQVCREQRYAYFAEVMEAAGAQKFATAHHADDQLETVLMAGLRGTLQAGTFGMPVKRSFATGQLIRPLLAVAKQEVAEYARTHGIKHREDASNAEQTYTRNRIRQTIVPLLKKESPAVSQHVTELVQEIQQDQQFLVELAKEKLHQLIKVEDGGIFCSAENFRREALALQKRLVLLLLNYLYHGKQVTITKQLAEQVQQTMLSSSGTVFVHLPLNYKMVRQYDLVSFSQDADDGNTTPVFTAISTEWSEEINERRYKAMLLLEDAEPKDAVHWYFSAPADGTVLIRNRRPGDRIQLAGMNQPKKVARLMIDEKVPMSKRENWPVIALGSGEILLIPGVRPSRLINPIRRDEDNWVLIEQQVEQAKSGL